MNNNKQSPKRPINNKCIALVRDVYKIIHHILFQIYYLGRIKCGNNIYVGKNCRIIAPGPCLIGNDVGVGSNFYAEANFVIGDETLISTNVSFVGNDHRFDQEGVSVYWGGRHPIQTIKLEGDNLIGYGVTIVGSVTIGKGCIVGAGAVVTKDLPPYTVCVGVPAKPIRQRFKSTI
jgi:acetyltransferase-like isoleucine patch superfamily enzyme